MAGRAPRGGRGLRRRHGLPRAARQPARHVEVQLLGDRHGNLVVPRRARLLGPAPPPEARRGVAVARPSTPSARALFDRACGSPARSSFHNAATVEFLLDADGSHYFLEMNTRLQVEHGVTELVTGLDLVAWQIRIAAGERLPPAGASTRPPAAGHAIEVRVYAEDPYDGFRPVAGSNPRLARCRPGPASGSTPASRRTPSAARIRPAARQAHGPRRRPAGGDRAPAASPGRDAGRRAPDRRSASSAGSSTSPASRRGDYDTGLIADRWAAGPPLSDAALRAGGAGRAMRRRRDGREPAELGAPHGR